MSIENAQQTSKLTFGLSIVHQDLNPNAKIYKSKSNEIAWDLAKNGQNQAWNS